MEDDKKRKGGVVLEERVIVSDRKNPLMEKKRLRKGGV